MKQKVISISFVIFIIGLSLLSFIFKDNELSKFERRKLAQAPKLDKKFIKNLDAYILDQFPFRNEFINLNSNINRNIYTKIKRYKDIFESADKILYIYGSKMNMEYLKAINEYEMMPIRIEQMLTGSFIDQKSFEDIVKDYTYVYIYRIDEEEISKIEGAFQYNYVEKDMLYKVIKHDDEILLEIVMK